MLIKSVYLWTLSGFSIHMVWNHYLLLIRKIQSFSLSSHPTISSIPVNYTFTRSVKHFVSYITLSIPFGSPSLLLLMRASFQYGTLTQLLPPHEPSLEQLFIFGPSHFSLWCLVSASIAFVPPNSCFCINFNVLTSLQHHLIFVYTNGYKWKTYFYKYPIKKYKTDREPDTTITTVEVFI